MTAGRHFLGSARVLPCPTCGKGSISIGHGLFRCATCQHEFKPDEETK